MNLLHKSKQMKTSIKLFAGLVMLSGLLFTNCKNSTDKVESEKEKVAEATENSAELNDAYLAEVEEYKIITKAQIEANEKSITAFNTRIANQKSVAKANYEKEIAALNAKNSDMKKKLEDLKADNQNTWDTFKTQFNQDMEDMGNSIRDFKIKD